jgi:hypothetical protein
MVKKPSSTLDTFVKPTPSPSSTSTSKLKRPSTPSEPSTSFKKKKKSTSTNGKEQPVTKKKRKPLIEDNRNLGTLELLDTTTDEDDDDDDNHELLPPSPPRRDSFKSSSEKGKGKMVLEEEDWMTLNSDDQQEVDSFDKVKEQVREREREEKEVSNAKKKVFGRWKQIEPVVPIASTSKHITSVEDRLQLVNREDRLVQASKSEKGKEKETIELSSDDDDDDDDLKVEGGLTCPMCKIDLETLPIKVNLFFYFILRGWCSDFEKEVFFSLINLVCTLL